MQFLQLFLFIFILLVIACESQNCVSPPKTITVDQSGQQNFKTIQSAIDSVPAENSQWIHIQISPGVYNEKVLVPRNKPCIYLKGAGKESTSIQWGDHLASTFYSEANNTIATGITFTNTLNKPVLAEGRNSQPEITQAVAARINADKCAFFNCAFLGVQDTLYDNHGRHYYHNCYIQGGIDFIFGNGQSIFEASQIHFSMGESGTKMDGVFTAQARELANDTTGFVFKNCNFTGTGGKAILGRSLRDYSRVIVANSFLSDVVRPEGWNAIYAKQQPTITYVEAGNSGPGANKSQRVKWMKDLSGPELDQFLNISFIDNEGWIANLPMKMFV